MLQSLLRVSATVILKKCPRDVVFCRVHCLNGCIEVDLFFENRRKFSTPAGSNSIGSGTVRSPESAIMCILGIVLEGILENL
jgi:hypothetical protein